MTSAILDKRFFFFSQAKTLQIKFYRPAMKSSYRNEIASPLMSGLSTNEWFTN